MKPLVKDCPSCGKLVTLTLQGTCPVCSTVLGLPAAFAPCQTPSPPLQSPAEPSAPALQSPTTEPLPRANPLVFIQSLIGVGVALIASLALAWEDFRYDTAGRTATARIVINRLRTDGHGGRYYDIEYVFVDSVTGREQQEKGTLWKSDFLGLGDSRQLEIQYVPGASGWSRTDRSTGCYGWAILWFAMFVFQVYLTRKIWERL